MSYNPIEAAEALQSIDQQTLNQYMRNPPPGIPGYQVAAEVARRADMAKRFAALDAKQKTDQQTGTVIDEVMRALNPGSVNPAPANPSQLASRSIPSNITGANAPMSPPAMRPPVNAGIASGMQAQPALSPQVMQAAGGTMGRTVYARHGGVPAGEVYGARGSDALEEALKRQRKSGARLYSKERSRSFEGDPKDRYPEQELKESAILALLASSARDENNIAHGGMGRTAFASNGTQGRTVYAQDGYVDPSIKMPNFPTRAAYEASIDPRGPGVAASKARALALQQQADFTRRGGPDFKYPADPRASSGPEMLAAQETRQRMANFGINPDAPNAISALADAEQGQLDAAQAYRDAQSKRGTLAGNLGTFHNEVMATQRAGQQLEAQREADRIASLTPEHEALRRAQVEPSKVRETGRENLDAMAGVHNQLAKGFTDEQERARLTEASRIDSLTPEHDALVQAHSPRGVQLVDHGLGGALGEMNIDREEVLAVPSGVTSIELARKYLAEPGAGGTTYGSAGEEFDYDLPSASEIEAQERNELNRRSFESRYGDQTTGPRAGDPLGDPRLGIGQGNGILTDTGGTDTTGTDTTGTDTTGADTTSEVVTAEVDQAVDNTKPTIETVIAREAQIARTRERDTPSGGVQEGQLGEGFEPLGEVDVVGMREDLTSKLTAESNKNFTALRTQIDKLKEYDPRADIEDVQQRRTDRIKKIEKNADIQWLLTASAEFLGSTNLYEGFGKTMEGLAKLNEKKQESILKIQGEMDTAELASRKAYAEYQIKLTDTESAFAAARRADAQGNQRLAESHIQTAVAGRAAANSLLADAAANANARLALHIQQQSVFYKKPTEAQTAARELIDNVFVNGTEAERVAFGFAPGATEPGQINLSVASPFIAEHLKNVMPPSSSGGYAEATYRRMVAKDARGELEDIKTGFDKAWQTASSAKSTLDLEKIAALTGTKMPTLTENSNMLAPSALDNIEVMGAVQDYMAWQSYRRNANNPAVTNEILRLYPKVLDIERRIENMNRAAKKGGGEGDNETSVDPSQFLDKS